MDHVSRLEAALAANHLYDEMRADVREVVAEVKRLRGEVAELKNLALAWYTQARSKGWVRSVFISGEPLDGDLPSRKDVGEMQDNIARLEGALRELRTHAARFSLKSVVSMVNKALAPAQEGGDE